MTRTFGPDNAIGWVQVRLRGGPRTLLTTTATYAGIIAAAMIASQRLIDHTDPTRVMMGWTAGIMALQSGVLLLFAPSRVAAAIRQDLTSGIIESHRLMPVAPAQAVLGYIFGATMQALCLALANLVIGGIAATLGGFAIEHWLGANVLLLTFAVFVWVLIAFIAFIPRSPIGLAFIIVPGITIGGQGGALGLAPGLTILATPLLGTSVFDMTATLGGLQQMFAVALAGQAVIGGLFFVAAARKYRRSDVIGFTPVLGLTLLAAWVVLSLVGTTWWEEIAPRFARANWVRPGAQLLTSIVIAMLLALVPVWAAAEQHIVWLRGRLDGDAAATSYKPIADWLVIVTATAIIIPLVAVADRLGIVNFPPAVLPFVALMVLFHLSASSHLRRAFRFYTEKANGLFFAWILILWVMPLFADVVRSELADVLDAPVLGSISCISPVGTMLALGNDRVSQVPVGLAVQGVLAACAAAFYFRTHPVRRRKLKVARVSEALGSLN